MRVNSNKKIHKRKRDPYQTLLRMAGILAVVVVVGFGIFFLCRTMIEQEFVGKRAALERENIEAEQEFNAQLSAMRNSNNASKASAQQVAEDGELPFWESTIDSSLWRIEDEGRAGLENIRTDTLDRSALLAGGLLLVNEWHSLPSDYSEVGLVSISKVDGFEIKVQNNSVRLFPEASKALAEMLKAAEAVDLKDYIVREAYRSNETQTQLFNDKMNELSSKYDGDILIQQTKKSVNYPGTSDYQSGLSFRMDLYPGRKAADGKDLRFQQSEEGQWFTENAWNYGIIFRFPTKDFPNASWEDKSYKTGVSAALNLYRYVGKAHSAAMKIMDYCLEEYVEFLKDHPHICIYQDGALKYEIFRLASEDVLPTYDIPVPNPASSYQASLDNLDGVVMAYSYNH